MKNIKDLIPEVKNCNYRPKDQFNKILDELHELEYEINIGNDERSLKECVDVIHASFNLLYNLGYTSKKILDTINDVVTNNRNRGYYNEEKLKKEKKK